MYKVYILRSHKTGRYYVGYTSDIERRLRYHNTGANKSTKHGIPWTVVYTESTSSKSCAIRRERQIKKYKGGEAFKRLVS